MTLPPSFARFSIRCFAISFELASILHLPSLSPQWSVPTRSDDVKRQYRCIHFGSVRFQSAAIHRTGTGPQESSCVVRLCKINASLYWKFPHARIATAQLIAATVIFARRRLGVVGAPRTPILAGVAPGVVFRYGERLAEIALSDSSQGRATGGHGRTGSLSSVPSRFAAVDAPWG